MYEQDSGIWESELWEIWSSEAAEPQWSSRPSKVVMMLRRVLHCLASSFQFHRSVTKMSDRDYEATIIMTFCLSRRDRIHYSFEDGEEKKAEYSRRSNEINITESWKISSFNFTINNNDYFTFFFNLLMSILCILPVFSSNCFSIEDLCFRGDTYLYEEYRYTARISFRPALF